MKRLISALVSLAIVIGLSWALLPVSRAAVIPYFISVNDNILPFNDSTMPLRINDVYFIPHNVLADVGVHYVAVVSAEQLHLYRGATRSVEFDITQGVTIDQDGTMRGWPAARMIGNRFYVPLREVANFFGLTYEILPIIQGITPHDTNVSIIRIQPDLLLNGPSFVGIHRDSLIDTYRRHFGIQPPPRPPDLPEPTLPDIVEIPPDFSDVIIYLSFFDLSAGGLADILDLFGSPPAVIGYRAVFFASAADIAENPGLIRRIFGSGHSLGIHLVDGTYEEYLETSALLLEAARMRSVLILAEPDNETAIDMAQEHGLVLWNTAQRFGEYDTGDRVTNAVSTDSGARQNLKFNASENTAEILPGVIAFLRTNNYTVRRITETVLPIRQGE